jgi:hypothetical protein
MPKHRTYTVAIEVEDSSAGVMALDNLLEQANGDSLIHGAYQKGYQLEDDPSCFGCYPANAEPAAG